LVAEPPAELFPLDSLVTRAKRGDTAAFRQLYEGHIDAVFGYCLAFSRNDRDMAHDLCQEAFATAFTKLGELRDPARFSGWLRTISRRVCLRWASRRRVEQKTLEQLEHEPRAKNQPDRAAEIVAEVIAACPNAQLREAALLFYTDPPHTTAMIGEKLNLSQTAVTTRLQRFRAWARRTMLVRLAEAMEE
jgi:RNA polymerase sigma factor (sigma-70 family)